MLGYRATSGEDLRKQILLLLTLIIVISTTSGCAFIWGNSPRFLKTIFVGFPPNILRPTQEQIVWSEREIELLESASERIEQYRKDDVSVLVVDAAGIPVANAVVHMDMLKHDFLFGAYYMLDRLPPPNRAGLSTWTQAGL
jgi:hypothetical protein